MTRRIGITLGVVGALLLLAVLAGVVGVLYTRPATAQTSVSVPMTREVTVAGRGEIKGRPDTAMIQIGVETTAPAAKDALAKNTEQAQALQAKLKELGVAEKDIQTSNFNIYPTYATDDERQITGYHVSNSVIVKIRDLAQAGNLLDQVVQAGANSIDSITFSVDDPAALLAQAREQAIRDARARADQLTKASGAAVGDVLVITESISSQPPMPMMYGRAVGSADPSSAVPVQAGEQSFTIDVQMTFAMR